MRLLDTIRFPLILRKVHESSTSFMLPTNAIQPYRIGIVAAQGNVGAVLFE
jgi:hypothetical protein